VANIEKCLQANFDNVIMVATTPQAEAEAQNILKKKSLTQHPKNEIAPPHKFLPF